MKKLLRISVLMLLFAFATGINMQAKEFDLEKVKTELPKLLGASNHGTEFYITFLPVLEQSGSKNFLKIFISSGVETEVLLEIPGIDLTKKVMTVPNDIVEIELTPSQGQPYRKESNEKAQAEKLFQGRAIHISAKDPIICYGVVRFEHTSDGYLAIPVTAFGKDYIVASYPDLYGAPGTSHYCSFTAAVAAYEGTKLTFTLGGDESTMTAGGLKPGERDRFNMEPGDLVLVGGDGLHADLTGSKFKGTKPIGVISGNQCAFVPNNVWACDHLVEMELPMETWGKEYHVTPIYGRDKPSYIRIFAKEKETTIYRDGNPVGLIKNVGGVLGEGWLDMRATDVKKLPRPVVIGGDKGISVTQYNPGIEDDDAEDTDPFQMVLTPFEQYQKEIVFNTPGIRGGMGFDNNFINLVYKCTEYGTIPDDIQFAEVKNGQFEWKKLSAMSPHPGTEFDIRIDNQRYFTKTIRLPKDGVYKIKANAPFAAYAYGNSWCDTYGFPTSVALGLIEKNDTVPPKPLYTLECDGSVLDGRVDDMPEEEDYRSNLGMVYMLSDKSDNYKFEYKKFMPGEDRSTKWTLEVIDINKEAWAVLLFSDRRGNDTLIKIEYFPIIYDLHWDHDFERLAKGDEATQDFWIVSESDADIEIRRIYFKSDDIQSMEHQNFTIEGPKTPFDLPARDSVKFTVRFKAVSEGNFLDSIGIDDYCFEHMMREVKARVGAPLIDVTHHFFGDVSLGKKPSGEITISNNGSSMLHVFGYTGPFHQDNVYSEVLDAMSEDNPLEIEPGGKYNFEVTFEPKAEIEYPDSIVFFSDTETPEGQEVDSVGELLGRGIDPSLAANSYDWGRVRIHRDDFPAGPYDPQNQVIVLENGGTEEVMVRKVEIKSDLNNLGETAFNIDRNAFKNKIIPAGESLHIPVTFQPTETGQYELVLTYDNTANSTTETVLRGVGILPRMETHNLSFGTTMIKDESDKQTKRLRFTNLSQTDWEYCDQVTITGFDINPVGSINTDGTYSNIGFQFAPNMISVTDIAGTTIDNQQLPITLQPGEYIEFDAHFVAQGRDDVTANISTVSDADSDPISIWTGNGDDIIISSAATTATICQNKEANIDLTITNSGDRKMTVTSLTINDNKGVYEFVNPAKYNDNCNFEIGAGQNEVIQIRFTPNDPIVFPATVNIVSNAQKNTDDEPIIDGLHTQAISCEAMHFTRTIHLVPRDNEDPEKEGHMKVAIGDKANFAVVMDAGEAVSFANIEYFNITLNYLPDFLKINENGDVTSQFEVKNLKIDDIEGKLTCTVKASSVFDNPESTDLLNIRLTTFLPKDKAVAPISVIVEPSDACLTVDSDDMELSLKNICAYDYRKIKISGTPFVLDHISPNPVSAGFTEIKFAVGIDVDTKIEIYNAMGEVVAVPVNSRLTSGEYTMNVPLQNLTSGTYYVKINAGPFRDTQKLVVVK